MKKLLLASTILALTIPLFAFADSTYICNGSALSPLTVSDPQGAGAAQVSSYIQQCWGAGGTPDGPPSNSSPLGASCGDGGTWTTINSQEACQPSSINSANQLSDKCTSDASRCSAAENAFLDGQKATQNSSIHDQGQGAQLNNQGIAAGATQYVAPSAALPQTSSAPTGLNTPQYGTNLTYIPLEPLCSGSQCASYGGAGGPGFAQYIANTYQTLLTFGFLLAVVLVVVGGILYETAFSESRLDLAKRRINAALWGLVIIGGSFVILYTLNPNLLNFNLNIQNSSVAQTSPFPNVTTPGLAQTVPASSVQTPAGTRQIIDPIQFNDKNSTDVSVAQAESNFLKQCQQNQGSVILAPGNSAGTTAYTCISAPGLY